MPRQAVVSTGARLHCGFFAHGARGERQFGGVGLMIGQPGFRLRGTAAVVDEVVGADDYWRARLRETVARYRASAPPEGQPPPVRWEIEHSLPPHAGLGSATQLALATATALALLAGEPRLTADELSRRTGRGRRSAIGIHGFLSGGLLIEGGKLSEEHLSPLITRVPIPEAWRVVLIRPRNAVGLSGADEIQGFARLPPMPAATSDRLCRIALLDLAPAAIEADFDRFADAIHDFGRLVGEYFASIQGGVYADWRMRELVPGLRSRGIRGIAQSSWGPTVFALCRDSDAAQALAADLVTDPGCAICEVTIVEPLNRGATVEINE